MKVLFISSGNNFSGISPVIENQGKSLKNINIEINHFTITEKGFYGYFKAIKKLKTHMAKENYDIVHAHYSLSGIVAAFAKSSPIVVSLMGSDVKAKKWYKIILYFFYFFFWDACIVKSKDMQKTLGLRSLHVIPNGVNINLFRPVSKETAQKAVGWNIDKFHFLFAANPERFEKNYKLALNVFEAIKLENSELHSLQNIGNTNVPMYYNAADVIILSSLWEGSPNVIKEAMACNRPILSTKVGDVEWLFGNAPGHFLASFETADFMTNLKKAVEFSKEYGKTKGQKRIIQLGIDSETIAREIYKVYKLILK